MAEQLDIPNGLREEHWKVIHFIRNTYKRQGRCPLVYQTCRLNGLRVGELKALFPTGYLRGACRLAGLTYKEGYCSTVATPIPEEELAPYTPDKIYQVDVRGFLIYPNTWDEQFATCKAYEMGNLEGLGEKHWQVIYYLRRNYKVNGVVPTIYETCEANGLELEDLERLFPSGYHRGAVKIAGLRVR
jgi:tRNA 2-thiouridine synthesizing protein E